MSVMVKRKAYDALVRLSGQFPVVAITGPRQSGKTTLAKMAFPEKQYVSLDAKNGFEVDAIADWKKSYAIEVKSSSDPEKKMSSSIRKYVNLRSDGTNGQVYYLGDLTCEVDGVKYVSWRDWGA